MLEDGDVGWKLVAPLSRLLGWALGLASAEMVTSLLTATLPPGSKQQFIDQVTLCKDDSFH